MNIETKLISSLEKVFPTDEMTPDAFSEFSCFKGEKFSFQLACRITGKDIVSTKVHISSALKGCIKLFTVKAVPVNLPCYKESDNYYIKKEPGLYPDLLQSYDGSFKLPPDQWRCLWVEVDVPNDVAYGKYSIELLLFDGEDNLLANNDFSLKIMDAVLPEQEILCTQWFHCDCLSTYYGVKPLSEEHWKIIDNYMKNYSEYGGNMLLTPVFTPALDTVIGGERPTVQLVDITETPEGYSFGFEKLTRFLDLAASHGINYFEIAHLFSQWGAEFTPKIVTADGRKIFGWDTSATSDEYKKFLNEFLPSLKSYLRERGILEHCYFHISDEPSDSNISSYAKAVEVVRELLADCNVMDALSDYKFCAQGLVRIPVAANDHVDNFIKHEVSPLWTYYCCGQGHENVSNRFIAMPSARNRILGLQLYKYHIQGFLHWGFNFWYSILSVHPIDPYFVNDGDEAFPAGDPFVVYPAADGMPAPSVREVVFGEAMQDARALSLLEKYMPHSEIIEWLEDFSAQEITFKNYPHGSKYILSLRNEINKKIESFIEQ